MTIEDKTPSPTLDSAATNGGNGAPAPNRVVEVGPDYHDHEPHFSPHDLARFELAQERVVTATQAIELCKRAADIAQREHAKNMQAIANEVAKLLDSKSARERALVDLRLELSKLYDMDLATIAYDDETGRIRFLPTEE